MHIEDAVNLDDLRKLARRRVPKVIYDFIEGGVDDEEGIGRNEEAFRRRSLVPRRLVDVSVRDQGVELFGRRYASPFGIGPTGGISNFRHRGDMMLAGAARDAGIPYVMSGAATASMDDLARTAPEHGWFQLYPARDRAIAEDMIRRAADHGFSTLVVTLDVPAGGNRERNVRNGFGRPLRLSLASKLDALRHPLWMKDYLRHGLAMIPNWVPYAPPGADAEGVASFVSTQLPSSVTRDDVARFRDLWPRNLVLKGIMRPDEAEQAGDLGVDGVVVSNHGARQVDRAPASLDVLPSIVAAVGDRMTVMLDSGVRRGADVLIALSLGARFVFLGRPTLYGLIAGGGPGAARAIAILRGEIDNVMAQIGCTSLDQLGPDFLEWEPDELARNRPR